MARLGDLLKIEASSKNVVGDKFWLLNLDMVEQQTGNILDYNYVGKDALNGSIIQFDTNCVLYSKLRPNLNKVVIPNQAGFATSEMLALRPNTKLLSREYLAIFLRSESFVTWATSKTAGAKMPRLGSKELLSKEIPLPTLSEQTQISARFTKINDLISLRKEQITKLDLLTKSRFIEMFEGKYKMVKLGDVVKTTSGGTPSKAHPEYYEKGTIPWLTSGEVNAGIITSVKNYITDLGMKNSSAKIVPANSVVIAMYGATAGVTGLIRLDTTTNQAVCSILPSERFIPEYLYHAVASKKDWMISQCQGGGQPNISQGIIRNMDMIDAPIEEQSQFAAFVEQIDKSKFDAALILQERIEGMRTLIQQSLEETKRQFDALMQGYFK